MLLTAELAALNLDPAQQEGVVAAVLPLRAEAEKLRAQAKLDALKIQALTLELAHLRRIRFGVKNEARALYGPSSDEVAALGLKKRSEKKTGGRNGKKGGGE